LHEIECNTDGSTLAVVSDKNEMKYAALIEWLSVFDSRPRHIAMVIQQDVVVVIEISILNEQSLYQTSTDIAF